MKKKLELFKCHLKLKRGTICFVQYWTQGIKKKNAYLAYSKTSRTQEIGNWYKEYCKMITVSAAKRFKTKALFPSAYEWSLSEISHRRKTSPDELEHVPPTLGF